MGKKLSKMFGFFKMRDDIDDYEDDDEDEDEDEDDVPESRFSSRDKFSTKRSSLREDANEDHRKSVFSGSRRTIAEEKPNKIVPYNNKKPANSSLQVSILSPKSIKEACKACDYLSEGKAVVLNLEGISEAEAQRIMDFVFGCMYAINGEYSQISSYIFIFVSQAGELLSDYEESIKSFSMDLSTQSGEFNIPVIKRDF